MDAIEEFDLVVIGAGPGGYVAALEGAANGLKTACIEKEPLLGGTCLRVGCIPSKTLLQSSHEFYRMINHADVYGLNFKGLVFDWKTMQSKKDEVVKGLCDSVANQFKAQHVTRYQANASFIDEHHILLDQTTKIKAKNIIIATGSVPIELPFLPLDEKKVLSSTGALSLSEIPKKMIVIGAGVIGVELASVFSRLGSEVTLVEMLPQITPGMDGQVSRQLLQLLKKQGLTFFLGAKVTSGTVNSKSVKLAIEYEGKKENLEANVVLVAVGRKPNTASLKLENAKVKMTEKGQIVVDSAFRTTTNNIYAIGDVIEGPMLAHKASEEAVSAIDAILGKEAPVYYYAIPNVVYTHPEAAAVGFTEEELKALGVKYVVGQSYFKGNARARAIFETDGFAKIIADGTTGKILGLHIIGPMASEMIGEGVLALTKKMSAHELGLSSHAHPNLSEAIKEAATQAAKKIA